MEVEIYLRDFENIDIIEKEFYDIFNKIKYVEENERNWGLEFALIKYKKEIYGIDHGIYIEDWLFDIPSLLFHQIIEKISMIEGAKGWLKETMEKCILRRNILEDEKIFEKFDILFENTFDCLKNQDSYEIGQHYIQYLMDKKYTGDDLIFVDEIIQPKGLNPIYLDSQLLKLKISYSQKKCQMIESNSNEIFEMIQYTNEKVFAYSKKSIDTFPSLKKEYMDYFLYHPLFFEKINVLDCFKDAYLFNNMIDIQIRKQIIQRSMENVDRIEILFRKIENEIARDFSHGEMYDYLLDMFHKHGINEERIDQLKERLEQSRKTHWVKKFVKIANLL